MQKHLSVCSGKAGFTYAFDNRKIIDYQDHLAFTLILRQPQEVLIYSMLKCMWSAIV